MGHRLVVNTAFAFTLWSHTPRTLSALQPSLINSTLVVPIQVRAWLFLTEPLTPQKRLGIAQAGNGALSGQL